MTCESKNQLLEQKLRIETLETDVKQIKTDHNDHVIATQKEILNVLQAVGENTKAITELTAATKDIVELSRDFQGIFRISKGLQDIAITITKYGAAIGLFMWIYSYLKTHFPAILG